MKDRFREDKELSELWGPIESGKENRLKSALTELSKVEPPSQLEATLRTIPDSHRGALLPLKPVMALLSLLVLLVFSLKGIRPESVKEDANRDFAIEAALAFEPEDELFDGTLEEMEELIWSV